MPTKKPLFTVTAKDCEWQFFVGTGNGGQNKQKTNSACRCTHPPSGAVGVSQESRDQPQNKKKAFERMAKSDKFQKWAKTEAMRKSGELRVIEEKVDAELLTNTKVEVKTVEGKWEEAPELSVNNFDILNLKESK